MREASFASLVSEIDGDRIGIEILDWHDQQLEQAILTTTLKDEASPLGSEVNSLQTRDLWAYPLVATSQVEDTHSAYRYQLFWVALDGHHGDAIALKVRHGMRLMVGEQLITGEQQLAALATRVGKTLEFEGLGAGNRGSIAPTGRGTYEIEICVQGTRIGAHEEQRFTNGLLREGRGRTFGTREVRA
jgi:hypothetical protein